MRHILAQQASRGLLGFYILGLLWAPLPLGSARPWATAWLALWFWLLAAAAAWLRVLPKAHPGAGPGSSRQRAAGGPRSSSSSSQRQRPGALAWGVAALLLAFSLWVGAQLSPWGYSADPHETRIYLLRSLGYVGVFVAGLLLVNTQRRRTWLLAALVAAGVLEALLAIVLFSAGRSFELFGTLIAWSGRATGTFPNFDHLAQFLALTLSAGVGLMLTQMGGPSRGPAPGWRERVHGVLSFMMSAKMLLRLMLVLMVIALVLTRSRMGNGVFFAVLLLLALWVMLTAPQLRRPAAWLVASLLVVDIVVVGQWVGLEKVVKRIENTELALEREEAASASAAASAAGLPAPTTLRVKRRPGQEETVEERLYAARDSLELVRRRPLAGHGGGAFYTVFPANKSSDFARYPYRWDHAHSDYVEIAADTGLVGLGLLAGVFLLSFGRALQLMRDHSTPHVRGVSAGVAMGLLCALLHGLVDFNLQINANAMTLTVLLVLVWSVYGPGGPTVSRSQTSR